VDLIEVSLHDIEWINLP